MDTRNASLKQIIVIFVLSVFITTDINGEYICQSNERSEVVCQKERLNINCTLEAGNRRSAVHFIKSNVGRKGSSHCTQWFGFETFDCDDQEESLRILNKHCGGKSLCNLKVTKDLFGNRCLTITKYLDVSYCCVSINYNGITVGVVIVVMCSLIVVGVLRCKRQKMIRNNTQRLRLTEHTEDYIYTCNGQQNMVLLERNRTNVPFQTIGLTQHRNQSHSSLSNHYEEVEIGDEIVRYHKDNTLCKHGQNHASTSSEDKLNGLYFVLEKTSKDYKMAKPLDDNEITYFMSDTEYAISGKTYHGRNDTAEDGHSVVANMYDSPLQKNKVNSDPDLISQITE